MTQLLVIAFRKQFAGKAYLKINLLVKTPLHRRSMEVRRSGLCAPDAAQYANTPPPVILRLPENTHIFHSGISDRFGMSGDTLVYQSASN